MICGIILKLVKLHNETWVNYMISCNFSLKTIKYWLIPSLFKFIIDDTILRANFWIYLFLT